MKVIKLFKGSYEFLSNFESCEINYQGNVYRSAEAAFQAAKIDPAHRKAEIFRKIFTYLAPNEAKALGQIMPLNPEWEKIKNSVMSEICRSKFRDNPVLRKRLLDTSDASLVEGNYWHDNIWGVCLCEKCAKIDGQNRLGMILMKIRRELKTDELN